MLHHPETVWDVAGTDANDKKERTDYNTYYLPNAFLLTKFFFLNLYQLIQFT